MEKTKLFHANRRLKLVGEKLQFNTIVPCCALGELRIPSSLSELARQLQKEKGTVLCNRVKQWISMPVGRWIWRLGKSGFNHSCGQCSALTNSEINEPHAPGGWCRAVEKNTLPVSQQVI